MLTETSFRSTMATPRGWLLTLAAMAGTTLGATAALPSGSAHATRSQADGDGAVARSSAVRAQPTLRGSCVARVGGRFAHAQALLRRISSDHSGYYISSFKMRGARVRSGGFVLFQSHFGGGRPAQGLGGVDNRALVIRKDLAPNTYYGFGRQYYNDIVFVTRRRSINGDPREKIAVVLVTMKGAGRDGGCAIILRQP